MPDLDHFCPECEPGLRLLDAQLTHILGYKCENLGLSNAQTTKHIEYMAMLTSFARPYFGRWSTSYFFFHHLWHANLRSGEEFYQLPPCPLRVATQVGLLLLLFALSKHILLREIAQSLPASTPSRGWKQHVFLTKSFNRKCLFFFFSKSTVIVSQVSTHTLAHRGGVRVDACHQFYPHTDTLCFLFQTSSLNLRSWRQISRSFDRWSSGGPVTLLVIARSAAVPAQQ